MLEEFAFILPIIGAGRVSRQTGEVGFEIGVAVDQIQDMDHRLYLEFELLAEGAQSGPCHALILSDAAVFTKKIDRPETLEG